MTPYEVVFNRKPKYYRVPVGARDITIDQVEMEEIDDEIDNAIVREAAEQLAIAEQAERR